MKMKINDNFMNISHHSNSMHIYSRIPKVIIGLGREKASFSQKTSSFHSSIAQGHVYEADMIICSINGLEKL